MYKYVDIGMFVYVEGHGFFFAHDIFNRIYV